MKPADLLELTLLAAIWGASFLFMRIGSPEFGPVVVAGLRVAGASCLLVPLLIQQGLAAELRRHWKPLLLIGLTNSALPFLCYAFAALAITGGLSAIFNATTPLWTALIAWIWLAVKPARWRVAGLAIGFAGVAWLAWDKAHFKDTGDGLASGWAVLACLCATALYGFSANFTRRHLQSLSPMTLATGTQLSAALVLAPAVLALWPQTHSPGSSAWMAMAGLAFLCTGIAYVMYFRLIRRVGATNAVTVTFLVPAFAVLWGALFIGESVHAGMLAACAVILVGTALVTGLVGPRSTK